MVIKGEVTTSVCRSNTDRSSEYKLLNKWAMQLYIEQIIQERIILLFKQNIGSIHLCKVITFCEQYTFKTYRAQHRRHL